MDLLQLKIGNSAGMVKTIEEVRELARAPITNIVLGSITVEERAGNPEPTFWISPDDTYALNSRGLPCRGISYYEKHGSAIANIVHGAYKKLTVSIVSTQSNDDWARLAKCATVFADCIELNLSCPNKWKNGENEAVIAENPDAVMEIIVNVMRVIGTGTKLSVKLPPYHRPLDSSLLTEIATAILESRAVTEVVSCNTIGGITPPTIDGKSVISMPSAGKSGPKIKNWSLSQVERLREFMPLIHITGVGGIRSGTDVQDYYNAGANGVQIGTHFFQYGSRVFEEIALELTELQT